MPCGTFDLSPMRYSNEILLKFYIINGNINFISTVVWLCDSLKLYADSILLSSTLFHSIGYSLAFAYRPCHLVF